MIRHITGTVTDREPLAIIIDVAGIGYQVFVSQPQEFKIDEPVTLHTHNAIRETASDLYGFKTRDEREVFELLLGLPKLAQNQRHKF